MTIKYIYYQYSRKCSMAAIQMSNSGECPKYHHKKARCFLYRICTHLTHWKHTNRVINIEKTVSRLYLYESTTRKIDSPVFATILIGFFRYYL